MNAKLTLLLLLSFASVAAEKPVLQSYSGGHRVEIQFPEPLVSSATVENGRESENDEMSDKDLGRDLFTISGGSSLKPTAEWADQDRLRITFPVGTSCADEFCFRLNPGTKYLGGAEAPQEEMRFHCPPDTLSGTLFMDGKGAGVVVHANQRRTKESRELSPASDLRFVFRQVIRKEERYGYGATVSASLEPAYLKQGVDYKTLDILAERGAAVWKSLTPDTQLPAHVVVRPEKPLQPGVEWDLLLEDGQDGGFRSECVVCTGLVIPAELGSGVRWDDREVGTYRLQVFFSHPMSKADMPVLFDCMRLMVDGACAAASGPGCKKLQLQNREIEFRYRGVIDLPSESQDDNWEDEDDEEYDEEEEDAAEALTYTPQDQVEGFEIEVSATGSGVLDLFIPEGTSSHLGFRMQKEHHHRIALNPACPKLVSGKCAIVPVQGNHNLQLGQVNVSAVQVNAWRLTDKMAQQAFSGQLRDEVELAGVQVACDVLKMRSAQGLPVNKRELEACRKLLNNKKKEAQKSARFSRNVLKNATPFPASRVEADAPGLTSRGVMNLNLDSVLGKSPVPGMYLLRLQREVNAPVRAALHHLNGKVDALDLTQDVLVQVTDLNVTLGDGAVLVNRFSDGAPVESATVSFTDAMGKYHEVEVVNGIAWVPEEAEQSACLCVSSGTDRVLVPPPFGQDEDGDDEPEPRVHAVLLLDRPLYRPGDTVHVRAVLRRLQPDGSCALPDEKSACIEFRRPDGSSLDKREISLGEYGAFEASFTLPKGEADVTGQYDLKVTCGESRTYMPVNCAVFRRDAFEATVEIEAPAVTPDTFTVRVQAEDYSGVPLSGAECKLLIEDEQVTLKLDAEGKAEVTRPVTPQMREDGCIDVSGTVTNDREEYVELEDECKFIYPADFYIEAHENRVRLLDSETDEVLQREQKLQLRLVSEESYSSPGANGLGMEQMRETVHWSGELVVPAGCELGMPLPVKEVRQWSSAEWKISGTDAAGRKTNYTTFCHHDSSVSYTAMVPSYQDGSVTLQVELPHDGWAHLFVGEGKNLRHLNLPVQAGRQTYRVELLPNEEGFVYFSLIQPGPHAGKPVTEARCNLFVPLRQCRLDVALQLPQQVCRPAETVRISGQVMAAGTPVEAEVTLYAVDEGMLFGDSSRGLFTELMFSAHPGRYFEITRPYASVQEQSLPDLDLLPAVWQGDIIGPGYSLSPETGMFAFGGGDDEDCEEEEGAAEFETGSGAGSSVEYAPQPDSDGVLTLRRNFAPVAVWRGALRTDAEGRFSTEVKLPDTLTTYRVYAHAIDKSGRRFGSSEGEFTVAQPVMLTPGTPFFMSLGDELRLPLTIVNNTDEAGTWTVTMEESEARQEIMLEAHQSATMYFDFKAVTEGEQKLRWTALGKPGCDAVQGGFSVRFPAPVLKEVHYLTLVAGGEPQALASLLEESVAPATRGEMQLVASTNPLLHLAGAVDFLLVYPYGCTEQRASALIPWLLYEHLSPVCPRVAELGEEKVRATVNKAVREILQRQCGDGGLAYWDGQKESCLWASAHAACVLHLARKLGWEVPQEKLEKLLRYLETAESKDLPASAQFSLACISSSTGKMRDVLGRKNLYFDRETLAGMRFILESHENPAAADAAFHDWLRTAGRDYRHGTTQSHAWTMLALAEYLHLRKNKGSEATLVLNDGSEYKLGLDAAKVSLPWQPGQEMKTLPTTLKAQGGTVYASLRVRALPQTDDFPGVTERGLQVTRVYETRGADGIWRPASEFKVGDVVRVTLTCAKVADEHKYLVLEDYLPACMEAINPDVPSQAAGLEPLHWSLAFDHREYLADRVRGFCTRWEGRDLLNMRYYARVKRAGTSAAPPAQAQLMYEPQVYGLSPNTRIISHP